jgi:RNA polymerase nonessential primary-like sigma factor
METLDKYMQDLARIIEQHPLLTRKQEIELARIIHKYKTGEKRQKAREELFFSNLRLVLQKAYASIGKSNLSIIDLINSGIEGLGKAIDRFKPTVFKTKFSTIATSWIDLKINRAVADSHSDVYIPRHIRSKSKKFKDLVSGMTDKEIMSKLMVSPYVLKNIQTANISTVVSLDHNYFDDDPTSTLKETIVDTKNKSPDLCCAERDRKALLNKYLNQLDPMEKDILCCRYMNNDQEGLERIGRKYGLSGERIRQISRTALRLLRRRMKKRSFFEV